MNSIPKRRVMRKLFISVIKISITKGFLLKKKKKRVLPILKFRLCLATWKLFSECKIFSSETIFRKGKYFQVFGCILKIVLENIFRCLITFWKCYFFTFFQSFSQLPNKFYNRKFSIYKFKETKIKIKPIVKLSNSVKLREGGRKSERLRERER